MDVFGAQFTPGVAWLFSGRALRGVRYAELDEPGRHVEVAFELGEETKGTLRVRVRQHLEWAEMPVFELLAPDPDEPDGAGTAA